MVPGGSSDTDVTWSCHVCGTERPDNLIGVYSTEQEIGSEVKLRTNVRYCLDRPACRQGAPAIATRWLAPAAAK